MPHNIKVKLSPCNCIEIQFGRQNPTRNTPHQRFRRFIKKGGNVPFTPAQGSRKDRTERVDDHAATGDLGRFVVVLRL
jgi:hypothetical protein